MLDNLDFSASATGVSVDVGAGDDRVLGSSLADTLLGGTGNDRLSGGAGDDLVDGGADNDSLRGGDGRDTVMGGSGSDQLNGDAGDDLLLGGEGRDSLDGGTENDTLRGEDGDDVLNGGFGNDLLEGGEGNDSLRGSAGDDTVMGGAGNDTLQGQEGKDFIVGGAGSDLLLGEQGDDTFGVTLADAATGMDTIAGGTGVNTVRLDLTGAEWANTAVQAELARYSAFITTSPASWVTFTSSLFGFTASNIQTVAARVDGVDVTVADDAVTALNDLATVAASAGVITGNVLLNDTVPDLVAGVVFDAAPAGFTGNADGSFTFNFDPADYAYLGAGEEAQLSIGYQVTDADGDTGTATLFLRILGVNDTALIDGTSTGAVTEDGTLTTSGVLTISDADQRQSAFETPLSLAGLYGSFTFDAATGAWSYTLDNDLSAVQALTAGQTLTDTLDVASVDGTATRTIAVTINGADDAASITGTATGAVTEDGTLTASGSLTVSDADAGEALFATPASLVGSYGSFTFAAATGAWDYTLDNGLSAVQALKAGETLTDTLAIRSVDGTTGTITVTITGVNDAPVFDAATLAFTLPENTTAAGAVAATDVDGGTIAYGIASGADGALFRIDAATGALRFAAAPNFEAPASQAGGNLYTVLVQAADGQGGVTQASVEVTVTDVAEAEAPSLIVTTLRDVVDGFDGLTSLREAIAHANGKAGADTITFAAGLAGTLLLGDADGDGAVSGGEAAGQLAVTGALTIDGRGSGGGLGGIVLDGGERTRILSSTADLTLQGLTLTRGNAGAGNGGAVQLLAPATALTVTDSLIADNRATEAGGLFAAAGSLLTLTRSTVSGNEASLDSGRGGGLRAGTAVLTDVTIQGNQAASGGGLYVTALTAVNTTLAANYASNLGGATVVDGNATLTQSTVTGNLAGLNTGGVYAEALTLNNSIVLGNARAGVGAFELRTGASGSTYAANGVNIVGTGSDTDAADGRINASSAGAVFAQTVGFVDRNGNGVQEAGERTLDGGVLGGRLADTGGPVPTVALAGNPANPALDAARAVAETLARVDFDGSGTLEAGVTGVLGTDARGVAAADVPGVGAEGAVPGIRDLGAYELVPEARSLVVTTLADRIDPFDGVTSLREAIAHANGKAGADTITFAAGLSGSILLGDADGDGAVAGGEAASQFLVTDTLTIDGRGIAGGLGDIVLDGGERTRILSSTADLTLQGLTLTRGHAVNDSSGGAIRGEIVERTGSRFVPLSLTVTDSVISGNRADSGGGGISLALGTLVVTRTTVSGNSAKDNGGGINVGQGDLTISDSTLFGNTANYGGGVSAETATLVNTTVAANTATGEGGGIYVPFLTLTQSTVTGNVASTGRGGGLFVLTDFTLVDSIVLGNAAARAAEFYYNSVLPPRYQGLNIVGVGVDTNPADGVINASSVGAVFAQTVGFVDRNGNGVQDSREATLSGGVLAGRLAENGGPVKTVALASDAQNPALDAARAVAETVAGVDFNGDGVLEAGVTGVLGLDARGTPAADVPGLGAAAPAPGIRDLGAFELTEGVAVPTGSLVVTTLADVVDPYDGVTSLREAIQFADSNVNGGDADGDGSVRDRITFAPGLSGTILLGDRNGDGDTTDPGEVPQQLVVGAPLIIDGNGDATGRGPITLDGGLATRILYLSSASALTLEGLTLTRGNAGSGIGGAIAADVFESQVTLIDSLVKDSVAAQGGGIGFYRTDPAPISTVELTRSVIAGNAATTEGGGIHLGALTVTDSLIVGNTAGTLGGGLVGSNSEVMTLDGSAVAFNAVGAANVGDAGAGRATNGGGGIAARDLILTDSTVVGNRAGFFGDGGANPSSDGAGISATTLTATGSLIADNATAKGFGGGVYASGGASFTDSTIAGNAAGGLNFSADAGRDYGGGVFSGGSVALQNTTVTANYGTGVVANSVTATNATVTNNAEGILAAASGIKANSLTSQNSILWDVNGITGTTTLTGNNLIPAADGSDYGKANLIFAQVGSNPQSASGNFGGLLAENGGKVPTVALRNDPSNPALDAAGAGALPADARGGAAVDVFATDTDG